MPESTSVDLWALSDLATPWCVHVVVTLRVAEHLADGPVTGDALARATGADRDMVTRVVRHLVGRGLFAEPAPDEFALTDAGRGLLDQSLRLGLDLDSFGGRMAGAWAGLLTTVRTGVPGYAGVYGRPFWEDLDAHPEIAADFDALMGTAGHGTPDADVLPSGGWDGVRRVVDVGGGTGALLAEVLRARPHVRGTLVELPRAVAGSAAVFDEAGVADRVDASAQSFLDPLPAGADVYLLKSVLANWPDEPATEILRRCAEAAGAHGRVVVLNGVSAQTTTGGGDLLMMVLLGGRGRSLDEFRALADAAGLEVTSAGPHATWSYVVECRRAG